MTKIPEAPQPDVPSLTQDALPDNAELLDVREQEEWDQGHAPHAIHIPLGQVEARLQDLPKGRPIVVVCRSGGRSSRVVAFLNDAGIEAVNLTGGMQAWQGGNRPIRHWGVGAPDVR